MNATPDATPPHIGLWISSDGRMRVRVNADGTFDEVRTGTGRTFHGVYRVDGSTIHFRDPATGYEAAGELREDGTMLADGCEFRK